MAITLSVGFVVDDAIVMLENIVRHMEMGQGVLEAAFDGSGEIAFTILSMTVSLAAVFIPVLFMGGIIGRLLHEFAVTIGVAILVSGFVSLTLTPMLCSRFLRPPGAERHGRLYQITERWFDGLLNLYRRSLAWMMRHRRIAMVTLLLLIVGTFWGFRAAPKGFLPIEDSGQMLIFTQAAQGISYDAMVAHQQVLNHMLAADPNVQTFFSSVGASGPSGTLDSGILFTSLIPRSQRKYSVDELIAQWRAKFSSIPGMMVFMQNPPPIQLGAHFTKGTYQMTLQGPSTDELYKYSTILFDKMRALPDLRDVNTDLEIKNPQVFVNINRDKARELGVTAAGDRGSVGRRLRFPDRFRRSMRRTMNIGSNSNLEPQYQAGPAALNLLYIRSTSGQLVPLNTVAQLTQNLGPLSVNHSGQLPAVTISFDVAPGVAFGKALAEVKTLTNDIVPASITAGYSGAAQAFESSLGNLGVLLLMAILVIYLVLGILYESFIHPLTILIGTARGGFRRHHHADGLPYGTRSAGLRRHYHAGRPGQEKRHHDDRLRAGCPTKPGPQRGGSDFRRLHRALPPDHDDHDGGVHGHLADRGRFWRRAPTRAARLGVAVVGGLVFSQFLTLYITPVFYTYMDSFQERLNCWKRRAFGSGLGSAYWLRDGPPSDEAGASGRTRAAS